MKKIFFVFMTGFISTFSFSQNTSIKKNAPVVQFGIKGGVNVASMKTDLYENIESRIGFHAGALSHIHLNSHLALQPEISYSAQGFKTDISSGLVAKTKLDYLNIPVLVQYMYKGFRIETGPQVGFLLQSKTHYTDGRNQKIKSYLQSTDFSWGFGASYLTSSGLGIDARYNLGINDINKGLSAPGVLNTNMSNRVWQFGLFYQMTDF